MPDTESSAGDKSGGAFLSLRGLTKRYGDFLAVDNITLDVPKGELVAFLGPSGCGKTTSLRMIAGLTPQSGGQIVVGGKDITGVPPYRRDMGLVFQSYALFPHMTVAKNVAFGLEMRGVSRADIAKRVREALALVHLQGMETRRPRTCRAGSSSASRWRARWSSARRSCCSTSRSQISMPSCATRCATRSATSSSGSASRRSSSRTIRSRR